VARRSLSPEEAALWGRVMASVRPLRAVPVPDAPPMPPAPIPLDRPMLPPARPKPAKRVEGPGTTLDASWDKRLARGAVAPDDTVDLHGHNLASAHALLDQRLGEAIARGDRVLLLVTGRPPRPESERPHARGAIRAAVADWLAASPHGRNIAAVRGAHPRHGGAGALYLVLRRTRG
jgi:DNA-nicking Smr family endonuclease